MVTVVGAVNFLRDLTAVDKLKDRKPEMGGEDERNIADLLRRSECIRQRRYQLPAMIFSAFRLTNASFLHFPIAIELR